jgi:peroxiredoxin
MPNDLTGDFDIVAEFTLGAANRVLAAMHCGERLPHSWSLQVDDYTHFRVPLSDVVKQAPVIRAIVDNFGEALTDPSRVAEVSGVRSAGLGPMPINPAVDTPVNTPRSISAGALSVSTTDLPHGGGADSISLDDRGVAAFQSLQALERASHLVGVAQLQMGAPTISLAQNSSDVVVHTPVMARYIGDPDTMQIPSLLRGEFQITVEIQQSSSSAGDYVNINLGGKTGNAHFVPAWVSTAWTSQSTQLASINKAIVNALKSSFEPSNSTLPSDIVLLRFKTMPGGPQPALAFMMDIPNGILGAELLAALFGIGTGAPDPSTVANVFLHDNDDFAVAIRSDDILGPFSKAVNDAVANIHINVPPVVATASTAWGAISYTFTTYTVVTIGEPTVSLVPTIFGLPGGVLINIPVHVHFYNDSSYIDAPDDFDFTIVQVFDFVLLPLGVSIDQRDPVINIPPSVPSDIANGVRSYAKGALSSFSGFASIKQQVSNKLSIKNLQDFLKRLMNPVPKPGNPPVKEVDPALFCTSFEVSGAGLVLHGVLQVPTWPKPHVEYSFHTIPSGFVGRYWWPASGEYTALRSWIPGGTIQEFIWAQTGGAPLHSDFNSFLFHEKDPAGLSSLCLTLKGTRISEVGPPQYSPVTAQSYFCSWHSRVHVSSALLKDLGSDRSPKIALVHPHPERGLDVVGHTSPWTTTGTGGGINLIVHFPDERSLASLDSLTHALEQSGRTDTASAILAVVSPENLRRTKSAPGIAFSDDEEAWAHLLGVKDTPATCIISPVGEVVFRHQGPLTGDELTRTLRKHLVGGGQFSPRLLQSSLRVGQAIPNFLLGQSPERELTVRKLIGRPAVVVFWKSSSQASIETVLDLQNAFANTAGQNTALLAICDGDPLEVARQAAAQHGITAVLVPDPDRDIAQACGISLWPTTIFLDSSGLVSNVRYGRFSLELTSRGDAGMTNKGIDQSA